MDFGGGIGVVEGPLKGRCNAVEGPFAATDDLRGMEYVKMGGAWWRGERLLFGRDDSGAADEVFLPVGEVEAYPPCAAFFDGLEMVVGAAGNVETGAGGEVVEGEVCRG